MNRRPKDPRRETRIIELVLLNISTGQHHVMTTQPVIHVAEVTVQEHCSVMLEIVGDHLALLLIYDYEDEIGSHNDTFYLYDWRSGTLEFVRKSHWNLVESVIDIEYCRQWMQASINTRDSSSSLKMPCCSPMLKICV